MNTTTHTDGALRRTGRALGRFWHYLAESAVPAPRPPLHGDKWSDYPRFPWF